MNCKDDPQIMLRYSWLLEIMNALMDAYGKV